MLIAIVLTLVLPATAVFAQADKGSIQGRVTDSSNAVLQGASVTVTPGGMRAVTNTEGEYTIVALAPGAHTVTVSFVGLKEFAKTVIGRGGAAHARELGARRRRPQREILVTAARSRGEAEQINRERTADNIVQVLSAEVITSLPNANIADAARPAAQRHAGARRRRRQVRADSRDRASPEQPDHRRRQRAVARERRPADQARYAGVRPRGLDRNQQDAAGQHGRRRHRRQREHPDQDRGRAADRRCCRRWADTRRSSADAASASPAAPSASGSARTRGSACCSAAPTTGTDAASTTSSRRRPSTSLSPHYDSIDLRDYMYYRTRWGTSGSADYRVNNWSSFAAARPVFDIQELGPEVGVHAERRRRAVGEHRLAPAGIRGRQSRRQRPPHHGRELAHVGRLGRASRMLQSGGNGGAKFKWNGADHQLRQRPGRDDGRLPCRMFSASCFTPGPTNTEDIANYALSSWNPPRWESRRS